MNIENFNLHLEAHRRWLTSKGAEGERLILQGVNLSQVNLRGAQLERASITGSDFFNTDLSHANLRGASLHRCDFRKTILRGAQLSGASLRGALFSLTDLSYTDMRGAAKYMTCRSPMVHYCEWDVKSILSGTGARSTAKRCCPWMENVH